MLAMMTLGIALVLLLITDVAVRPCSASGRKPRRLAGGTPTSNLRYYS